MKLILAFIAVACGAALVFSIPTGQLASLEVAGIGLCAVAVAVVT